MRILRVIARLNAGGPAHHVGILSSRLEDRGFRTLLVHGDVAADEVELSGFGLRYPARCLKIEGLGPDASPMRTLRALRELVGVMRRLRPSIVHTHTAKAGALGRVAACVIRPRPLVVHTFHGHVLEGYFGPVRATAYRILERALGAISDRLVGVSDATVADLCRLGVAPPRKFRVIPLGLELEPFLATTPGDGRQLREQLSVGDDETLVLVMGRLVPVKNLPLALAAVAEARLRGAPVRVAFAGEGSLRAQLEHYAETLDLGDVASFLGHRDDVVQLAAAADVGLLTSRNEGTPVALIELAAAGRPAVAIDVGGVREVITPASGVVLDRPDADALASALIELAESPRLRESMGAAARRHVERRYACSRLLDDVEDLYRELLCCRSRSDEAAHRGT